MMMMTMVRPGRIAVHRLGQRRKAERLVRILETGLGPTRPGVGVVDVFEIAGLKVNVPLLRRLLLVIVSAVVAVEPERVASFDRATSHVYHAPVRLEIVTRAADLSIFDVLCELSA